MSMFFEFAIVDRDVDRSWKMGKILMGLLAEKSHNKLTFMNATALAFYSYFVPVCSYKIPTCFESYM